MRRLNLASGKGIKFLNSIELRKEKLLEHKGQKKMKPEERAEYLKPFTL